MVLCAGCGKEIPDIISLCPECEQRICGDDILWDKKSNDELLPQTPSLNNCLQEKCINPDCK